MDEETKAKLQQIGCDCQCTLCIRRLGELPIIKICHDCFGTPCATCPCNVRNGLSCKYFKLGEECRVK